MCTLTYSAYTESCLCSVVDMNIVFNGTCIRYEKSIHSSYFQTIYLLYYIVPLQSFLQVTPCYINLNYIWKACDGWIGVYLILIFFVIRKLEETHRIQIFLVLYCFLFFLCGDIHGCYDLLNLMTNLCFEDKQLRSKLIICSS